MFTVAAFINYPRSLTPLSPTQSTPIPSHRYFSLLFPLLSPRNFFSSKALLPALMSRVGLLGVLLMGVVSGYGSIQNPVQLFWLRNTKRVEDDTLLTYADRCTQASRQLESKRALLRERSTTEKQDGSTVNWLMKRVSAALSQQGNLAEEVADLEMAVDSMQSEYSSLKALQVSPKGVKSVFTLRCRLNRNSIGRYWADVIIP